MVSAFDFERKYNSSDSKFIGLYVRPFKRKYNLEDSKTPALDFKRKHNLTVFKSSALDVASFIHNDYGII